MSARMQKESQGRSPKIRAVLRSFNLCANYLHVIVCCSHLSVFPCVVRFDIFGQYTRDPNGTLLGGFLRSAVPSYGLWQSQQDLQLSNRPVTAVAAMGILWTISDYLTLSVLLI